jgi:predicted ribosome quality control (RQC) complex YloA/Tae2 family protein
LDTVTLASVVAAANRALAGKTARGLITLGPDVVALRFAESGVPDLVFSAAWPPALYLSGEEARPSRELPPLADAKLFKRAVVNGIRQWSDDRIVVLDLTLGSGNGRRAVIELYRRTGSLYLVDENDVIVSTLYGRRLKERKYPFPEIVEKAALSEVTPELVESCWGEDDRAKALRERVSHLSPVVAGTLAGIETPKDAAELLETIASAIAEPEPVVVRIGGEWKAFPVDIFRDLPEDDKEYFDDISKAVAAAGRTTAGTALLEKKRSSRTRELWRDIKRLKRQLKALEEELSGFEDPARYRELGDILKANLSKLEKGTESVEVEDLYRGGTIIVELERDLSPQKNVAAYYKKYRKAVRGHEKVVERLAAVKAEIGELEEETEKAATADLEELELPADEIAEKRREPEVRRIGRRYVSSEGFEIIVGRGARENYAVTFGVGRPGDLWLHVREARGSHVVIRCKEKGKPFPKRTIEEAAALAAYHSKSRNASLVPVIVTERRYVQRAKGAPGLVRVMREDVIFVEPGEVLEPVREA